MPGIGTKLPNPIQTETVDEILKKRNEELKTLESNYLKGVQKSSDMLSEAKKAKEKSMNNGLLDAMASENSSVLGLTSFNHPFIGGGSGNGTVGGGPSEGLELKPQDTTNNIQEQNGMFDVQTPKFGHYTQEEIDASEGGLSKLSKLGANYLAGAGNTVLGVADAVLNPIDTVKTVGKTALGAGENIIDSVTGDEGEKSDNQKLAGAIWDSISKKYGSSEEFKKTMVEDPMSFINDVLTVASGGGAAVSKVGKLGEAGGTLSKIGKAGEQMSNIANKLDVGNLPGAVISGGAKLAGKVGSFGEDVMSVQAGLGFKGMKGIRESAAGGGPGFISDITDKEFADSLSSAYDNYINTRKQGIGGIYDDLKTKTFNPGEKEKVVQGLITDFLDDTLPNKLNVKNNNGQFDFFKADGGEGIKPIVDKSSQLITSVVDNVDNLTPYDLVNLKRNIGNIPTADATQRRALNVIQDSLDKHIESVVPGYSKSMKQVEETYSAISELKDSIGNVEKQQQAVNRFMNAMKTDKQLRIDGLKVLNKFTNKGEDLIAMTSSLNGKEWVKGMWGSGFDTLKTGASAFLGGPILATISIATSSPKLMAYVANGLGVSQGYIRKIVDKINQNAIAKTGKELITYGKSNIGLAGKYITPNDDKEETLIEGDKNKNTTQDYFANY